MIFRHENEHVKRSNSMYSPKSIEAYRHEAVQHEQQQTKRF